MCSSAMFTGSICYFVGFRFDRRISGKRETRSYRMRTNEAGILANVFGCMGMCVWVCVCVPYSIGGQPHYSIQKKLISNHWIVNQF